MLLCFFIFFITKDNVNKKNKENSFQKLVLRQLLFKGKYDLGGNTTKLAL